MIKKIYIDETDSTNNWVKANGGEDIICVVADNQTAGRGCGRNTWESERGKNLTFSLLIHPEETPANRQFGISEAVAVALCDTLALYHINNVKIKWPNDIYVDDRKICGMLIENRLLGATIKDSIIGIGLNVNQRSFEGDAPNPVSMYQCIGRESEREEVLQRFLNLLKRAFESKTTAQRYRQLLYRRNVVAEYQDKDGCFRATLIDVKDDGRLVLRDEEGNERLYAFKEVKFCI